MFTVRRALRLPGGSLFLALALAACGGASDDSGGGAGTLATFTASPGLCGQGDLPCAEGESPPDLVGAYSGNATIALATTDLWEAGESFTLAVEITAQRDDLTVDATVRLDGIALEGQGSLVRGEGDAYSLYVKSEYRVASDCALGILAVISGTGTSATRPATLEGRAKWVLQEPVGAGCGSLDADQQEELRGLNGFGALADYRIDRTDTPEVSPDAGASCECDDFVDVCDPGCVCDAACAPTDG
ncbi:MAG: hypothetical protein ACOYM9_11615 [Bradymonadia bacterium]